MVLRHPPVHLAIKNTLSREAKSTERRRGRPTLTALDLRLTIDGPGHIIAATMVRIRLQRVGAKNQPSYRVIVVD